jgi:hypothetical protein
MCVGAIDPCMDQKTCTSVHLGPCEEAGAGPSSYISSAIEGIAFLDEATYLTCADDSCATVVEATGPGYRDLSGHVEAAGGTYAFSMSGNLFGDSWGGYVGTAAYFNTGSTNIISPYVGVYTAHPLDGAQTPRGDSDIGAPGGPYGVCIADGSTGTCEGHEVFGPGAFYNTIFGYAYETVTVSTADEFTFADGFIMETSAGGSFPESTSHFGVRQSFTAVGFDPSSTTLNGGTYTLEDIGNTDVTDIHIAIYGYGTLHFKFPATYNYGPVGGADDLAVDPATGMPLLPVSGSAAAKVKVSWGGVDLPNTIYVDYLFEPLTAANQYFIYGMLVTSTRTPPPPSPSLISWVKAASSDTCVGTISDCDSEATCTSAYIGPCTDAASGASAYLAQAVHGAAFVDESQYLSCSDINSCEHAVVIQSTGPGYRDFSESVIAGDSTYAYTMAGNLFGSTWGGYLGVASYFNTGNADIETATNDFFTAHPTDTTPVTRGSSPIGAPSGPFAACIADGTSGTCTGTRVFSPGAYKFSIFGYTYESTEGLYGASFAAAVAAGQLPNPTTHLGVRTTLTAVGFDATGITFNGGTLTPDTLGTTPITDFTLPTPIGKIKYLVPTAGLKPSFANPQTPTQLSLIP